MDLNLRSPHGITRVVVGLWPSMTIFVHGNFTAYSGDGRKSHYLEFGTGLAPRQFVMADKINSSSAGVDGNWQWPEKTWFRERLNALKAREQEARRRPLVDSKAPSLSAAPTPPDADP
ncbi:MAG TPA: hypothetical protein VMT22_25090, partial [Terriglobales bacterium]|nr:hypothetical protein [Terriglobales bacterium]